MKRIHYAGQSFDVADDVADELLRASTEFANEGQAIDPPVACYIGNVAATVSMVVGVGIPLLVVGIEDDVRPDPPMTLASWEWIKSAVDNLQADQ